MRTAVAAPIIAAATMGVPSLDAQVTVPATKPPTARVGGNILARPTSGPVPRHANGRPDLTGLWLRRGGIVNIADGLPKGETMPLRPETLQRMRALQAKDDPQTNCLPLATPRGNPYPFRMVETPTHLFIINESMHGYRQVFMDGRRHPDPPEPSWHGHSIGRWDGDTLVVDTVGFNDLTWFDNYGHLHSDRLHTIERFTRTDLGTLQWEILVDDPVAYTRPFTLTFTALLMPKDQELMEYMCEENNQDRDFITGPAAAAAATAK